MIIRARPQSSVILACQLGCQRPRSLGTLDPKFQDSPSCEHDHLAQRPSITEQPQARRLEHIASEEPPLS
jgi:hypothetical protein